MRARSAPRLYGRRHEAQYNAHHGAQQGRHHGTHSGSLVALYRHRLMSLRARIGVSGGAQAIMRREGTGVEFFGFREYQYGDAMSRIDWVRSERLQKPIVRTTHDAHDMDIVLVVDRSVSTTTPYSNTDMASIITEVASIVVAALADIECALTVVPFADRVMRATHSHGNRDGIERHLAHLRAQQVATRYADLSLLIETVMRTTPRRSLIIILSAFDDDGYQQQLISLASRHHVCAILLYDSHALDGMQIGRYCAYIDRAHAPRRSYSRCTGALRHELERRDRDARHAWHDSALHHGINALSVDIAQSPLEECVRALSA